MKVGLNGLPPPDDCPVSVVRWGPEDAEPANIKRAADYFESMKGVATGIGVFPWRSRGVRAWAKVVNTPFIEYGNEPHPEDWPLYRKRLRTFAPFLYEAGYKVILAAAQTAHTKDWLDSTPDRVFDCVQAVAVHPYASTLPEVLDILYMARTIIPDPLPIFVTEIGKGVGIPSTGRYDLTEPTEDDQAEWLAGLFRTLHHHAADTRLRIPTACWFCDQDIADPKFTGRWQEFCGVRDKAGEHKPAWDALKDAA